MNLPDWLVKEAEHDLAIQSVISQGEKEGRTELEAWEAICKMLLSRNAFLFVELGKLRKQVDGSSE